jgi:hypothetical protein
MLYCHSGRTELVCYDFYSRTQSVVYLYHKYYLGPNSDTPLAAPMSRRTKHFQTPFTTPLRCGLQ